MEVRGIIVRSVSDRDGAWKLTLEIPDSDALKAAALATQKETVFKIRFVPEMAVEGAQQRRATL